RWTGARIRGGLFGRLYNVRDAMEDALGHVRGIEDDYRRGLLEAHIRGALREINEQIAELASPR
ncbi:MAG TPA: hypothetical protein VFV45_03025, partial [Rubrobacteraceae bacterium]|nr:hypothetical protein [Rubrobacteraceae bacterium]